jgi:hypothetical protein
MNTLYVSPPFFGVWRLPLAKNNLAFLKTDNSGLPVSYSLSQNYPNPFNPTTNIQYEIPKPGDVRLVIYDVTGREVRTLINERLEAGKYEVSFDGSALTSGVYFYMLQAVDFSETKRMILIK